MADSSKDIAEPTNQQLNGGEITEEMLPRLMEANQAKGYGTEAYKWEFPKERTEALPMSEVQQTIRNIVSTKLLFLKRVPDATDEDIRDYILSVGNRKFNEMHDRTSGHPHLFDMITKKDMPLKHLRTIMEMTRLQEVQANSKMTNEEKSVMVTQYFEQRVWNIKPNRAKTSRRK